MTETIVALASGRGKAGVAVIRISGPRTRAVLEALAGGAPEPRRLARRRLRLADEFLDDALVAFFPAPHSFTGEDVAELHVHGGRAVIAAVTGAVLSCTGVVPAEAGAFTRRAVANGQFDLTGAEALAALVDAETASQRRQALHQAGGVLEAAARGWRVELTRCLALMEAEIDFPDEDDVPAQRQTVQARLMRLNADLSAALGAADRGERLRDGATIVLAGPPNAGKSTLMNALARRDVAIVSPVAGTTRDVLEAHLDLGGHAVTLIDTAGIRDTSDEVEQIGVERARARAAQADVVVWLVAPDADEPPPRFAAPVLAVRTKAELGGAAGAGLPTISARTGAGLAEFEARLTSVVAAALEGGEAALITRARHRREVEQAAHHVAEALAADAAAPVEFIAEDLRLAVRAIGRLTGKVDIDEVYDLIFREFCIGK